MDVAEKKGAIAFKWEDAPKRQRFEGYHWITSWITGKNGMIKDAKDWGVMIQNILPGRGVPPDMKLHLHKRQDTIFLVLKGRLVWCIEGTEYELGAGSFIWIPRDTVHEIIEVIEQVHLLAMVSHPAHGIGTRDNVTSDQPWYEQFPSPRPRKVISTRGTCLYDGTSHHAPYKRDKERRIVTDKSPTGAAVC
jgi:mannose-6-phosphate isomerase-like protein (cupin superfamily)